MQVPSVDTRVDRGRLLETFLRLVRMDSPSRGEGQLAELLTLEFARLGWRVRTDQAGNVIASNEGDQQSEPVLFSSHMDVVMPCIGVRPRVEDGVIRSSGDTVLGADAKASVAALLEAARVLGPRHAPIECIFTVGEEIGHLGAKELDVSALRAKQAWVLDGLVPVGTIIVAAPTYYSFVANIHGRAAHAGVEPERGISSIATAAGAIAQLEWGRLDAETTANIGTIRGGSVRNAVPAHVELEGEVRSLSADRAAGVAAHIETTFTEVARQAGAELDFRLTREYAGYTLRESEPVVDRARQTFETLKPGGSRLVTSGGGSDANEFNGRGLRSCVLGIGAEGCHSVAEHISLDELDLLAQWVLRLTQPSYGS
jgi:tripeptide aminopeptidase